ncbi:MAG: NADH-quinone oxidoreductase subunit NuoE [Bacteroidales bacterium]|jgi:NADH-quinone oxidoreductase subunit E|nr:NADH-quinone oxidoreductase subunit NuoE [Bacteroidales bacterium]MDD3664838.1 NADH-quinone oxidoreductase subunit NuoE [Bacteroidales bacterium]
MSEKTCEVTRRLAERFPNAGKENLLQMLQEIQREQGYLTDNDIRCVGRYLRMPVSRIYSIATFYNQFRFAPAGRYQVKVCRGTACHVMGSVTVLQELIKQLGIEPGQTTRNGQFSLEVAECMGACSLSPVIAINDVFFDKVTPERIRQIINEYRNRED